MSRSVYNIVKGPTGWLVFCNGVRLEGVYETKEAALEAGAVAGAITIGSGQGVQINVPEATAGEAWPSKWNDLLKINRHPERLNDIAIATIAGLLAWIIVLFLRAAFG